ncbi:MAG: hypothetical protein GY909_15990 [Oligoflexia bacterium]|nr:hypothetical protein [Oligoflexia bacterium]
MYTVKCIYREERFDDSHYIYTVECEDESITLKLPNLENIIEKILNKFASEHSEYITNDELISELKEYIESHGSKPFDDKTTIQVKESLGYVTYEYSLQVSITGLK